MRYEAVVLATDGGHCVRPGGSISRHMSCFADMIERHWNGIAACCRPENKVSRGFIKSLNTKNRVLRRRASGLRDEEFLRFKVATCMPPAL